MKHLGSYDERFCGSREQGRQFVTKDELVTCLSCQEAIRKNEAWERTVGAFALMSQAEPEAK